MKSYILNQSDIELMGRLNLDIKNLYGCSRISYSTGEKLYIEGNPSECITIIVSGKAKVFSMAKNGKNMLLSFYMSDGIMGDSEMMTKEKKTSATVVALSDLTCIVIPYKKNMSVLKNNLLFMNIVAESLAYKLIESSNNWVFTALYSGEQRLCSYIMQASYKSFFKDNFSDVADAVGISYRHMFRILKKLCQENILLKKDGGYLIINSKVLQAKSAEYI